MNEHAMDSCDFDRKKVRNFCIRKLAVRSYHSKELSRLLAKQEVPQVLIASIVEELQSLGYVNDKDWVKSFIRIEKQKKKGNRSIALKLQSKGIWDFELPPDEVEEQQIIRALLVGKYRTRNLSDYKERQKIIASLIRRGFLLENILEQLNMPENDESFETQLDP